MTRGSRRGCRHDLSWKVRSGKQTISERASTAGCRGPLDVQRPLCELQLGIPGSDASAKPRASRKLEKSEIEKCLHRNLLVTIQTMEPALIGATS